MTGISNSFKGLVGERILSSFDYLDIAKGNAIQRFFAGSALSGTTPTTYYVLSDSQFYSSDILLGITSNGVFADTLKYTANFDVLIGTPIAIKGTTIIGLSFGGTQTTGNGQSTYLKVYLKKISGGSPTTLGTAKSTTYSNVGTFSKLEALAFDVAKTHFKIGDTLRMTVEIYQTSGGAFNMTTNFGCDPKNRNGLYLDTTSSVLDLYLPVVVIL